MVRAFNFFDGIVTKMALRETNPINQTRIRMLTYFMVAYIVFAITLLIIFNYTLQNLQLFRASVVLFLTFSLLLTICYLNWWKFVAHFVTILLTLNCWTNLLLYQQGFHATTLQYVWLATAISFYILGSKWGWFYSTINVIPIILFIGINISGIIKTLPGPFPVNTPVYVYAVSYNFMVIIFLHYYFFKRLYKNFASLISTNQQIDELNGKLEATLVDVRKLSKSRMDFLSTMSHELRTPLNGVIGISNALIAENPREDQKQNLDILKFSAENLLSLINDILDFNKLDSGKMDLEKKRFDLYTLLQSCFNSLQVLGRNKNLELHLLVDDDIKNKVLVGDPTRLTQIFLNLLNNALKFTEKGSITFLAQVLNCDQNKIKIHFAVEDSGIGIPADQQKTIFDVFYQVSNNADRSYGGTGLGLPIIKKILHLLDSEIYIESKPNEGSTFYFDLEFDYETTESIASKSNVSKESIQALKVLVVEDHAINVIVIRKTLERWEIHPVITDSGKDAINRLKEADFDVILMDLYMPEMDGYETTQIIRKMEDTRKSSVPIIALTAASMDNEIINRIQQSGMNDYLSKPFSPEDLFQKLEKIVKNLT